MQSSTGAVPPHSTGFSAAYSGLVQSSTGAVPPHSTGLAAAYSGLVQSSTGALPPQIAGLAAAYSGLSQGSTAVGTGPTPPAGAVPSPGGPTTVIPAVGGAGVSLFLVAIYAAHSTKLRGLPAYAGSSHGCLLVVVTPTVVFPPVLSLSVPAPAPAGAVVPVPAGMIPPGFGLIPGVFVGASGFLLTHILE